MNNPVTERRLILLIGLISELALFLVALLWLSLRSLPLPFAFSAEALIDGVLLTLPILVVNGLVFFLFQRFAHPENVFNHFFDSIIKPLCLRLDLTTAFIIALASGVGEELFFRGALAAELNYSLGGAASAILSSFLFAYVHFISVLKRFWPLVIYYFFFGLYFWLAVSYFQNITPAIVAHALYNFVAMVTVRALPTSKQKENH